MADYSIYLFHIFFVGPLLLAIGLLHDHPKFPKFIWQLLIIMGAGIIVYHMYMMWKLYKVLNIKVGK